MHLFLFISYIFIILTWSQVKENISQNLIKVHSSCNFQSLFSLFKQTISFQGCQPQSATTSLLVSPQSFGKFRENPTQTEPLTGPGWDGTFLIQSIALISMNFLHRQTTRHAPFSVDWDCHADESVSLRLRLKLVRECNLSVLFTAGCDNGGRGRGVDNCR